MNGVGGAEKAPWSNARWIVVGSILFAIQLAVIFFLSQPETPRRAEALLPKAVFVGDGSASPALADWLAVLDPTIFAHANPHGFSDVNWLPVNRFNYRLTKWTEPLRWLPPAKEELAREFQNFVKATVPPSTPEMVKPPPALARVTPVASAWPERARLKVEGDLRSYRLLTNLPPPLNTSQSLLKNTVVRVTLNEAGRTLSAAIVSSSGAPQVDQSALIYAKQARFAPVPVESPIQSRLTEASAIMGHLVFQWFPVSVSKTNQPAASP